MKSRESKMLGRVRRWRKKAYKADKTKPLSERAKKDEKLARKFDLLLIQTHKAGPNH
ncbi:MAG: hypothetical protein ACYTBX_00130 [Planctomycetota bacterium]|jgi:hypothetical protein